jgi:UDP-N-acetylmuramoylalanine--D-glutamate ligase
LALTKGYAPEDKALSIIQDFLGIEHRAELFLERHGVRFINSSIDTSPERTATTLKSIDGNIILMLGGKDKGLPFEPIIDALDHRVKLIILFGEIGPKFTDLLPNTVTRKVLKSFEDATREAMEVAKDGDTVLLSPGASSYDEFSSFEERGEFFKSIILANF